VIIFAVLFLFTSFCFWAVRKLPLTMEGIGIFRRPLVSGTVTRLFYQNITSKILALFYNPDELETAYPAGLIPVGGKIYSGNYIYFGRGTVCDLNGSSSIFNNKICLQLENGERVTAYVVNGVSEFINSSDQNGDDQVLREVLILNQPYAPAVKGFANLASGTKVEFFLEGDRSPADLIKSEESLGAVFNIRELRVLEK